MELGNLFVRARETADHLRRRALAHIRRADPLFISLLIAVAIVAGAGIWFTYDALRDLPSTGSIRDLSNMAQATTLFDDHDKPAFTLYQERRLEVPLSAMSPNLIKAIIAIEDQRFYDHQGVDPVRVIG